MARVKQIIGWTAIVLFAATLAGIWVLTEQNAVETSLLSESTARVVEGQATGVQAADVAGEAQTENGMTGGTWQRRWRRNDRGRCYRHSHYLEL